MSTSIFFQTQDGGSLDLMKQVMQGLVLRGRYWTAFEYQWHKSVGHECLILHVFVQTAFCVILPTWLVYLVGAPCYAWMLHT